jgi:hypothetical protein
LTRSNGVGNCISMFMFISFNPAFVFTNLHFLRKARGDREEET